MLHTWTSDNRFFERPTTPDGSNDTTAPPRPPAGTAVKVRDASDGTDLPDLILDAGGLWSYGADSDEPTMAIALSYDGSTWSAPLWSQQSFDNMAASGDASVQAAQDVVTLTQKVDQLESDIESSVAGVAKIKTASHPDGLTGTIDLTPAELGARPSGVKVPAADVDGLKPVATSGEYGDLTGKPAPAVPLASKGVAFGVASLDGNKRVPVDQLPAGFGTVGSVADVDPGENGDVSKEDLIAALDVPTRDDLAGYAKTSDLKPVATSGAYSDLTGKPGSPWLLIDTDTGEYPARDGSSEPRLYNDCAYVAGGQSPVTPTDPADGDFWYSLTATA